MNYESLTIQIQNYVNRNEQDFLNAIPNIINQAMSRIYSEAKTIGFQKVIAGNFIVNTNTIAKPNDYKETISFRYTIEGPNPFATFLLPRTYEFCVTYAPNVNAVAPPVFYSADLIVPANNIGGAEFYIAPTPDVAYPYQLTYLSFPPDFQSQVNGGPNTNFLTDKYPNLLLYACMVEAIPFLKSDERIPVFESLYNRALQGVNMDTKERYTDRISKRDKD